MYGLVMLGRNIDGGDLLWYGIIAWLRDSLPSPFCYCLCSKILLDFIFV